MSLFTGLNVSKILLYQIACVLNGLPRDESLTFLFPLASRHKRQQFVSLTVKYVTQSSAVEFYTL